MYNFEDVTLLITHYNRSHSLENLLNSFKQKDCSFGQIVVSDDGSKPEHLEHINKLQIQFSFQLVTTSINKGLGNNLNKGQDAVSNSYTLYVQEDFEPTNKFPSSFVEALKIIKEKNSIDIVRFYAYFKFPYLKPIRNGFSEMDFKIWYPGYRKFYYYSDHPHLRRSNFLQKFGRYDERSKSDKTEYKMMMSFLSKGGKGVYYDEFQDLFDQKNSVNEPSTVSRSYLMEAKNPFVTGARNLYRHLKFNIDYLIARSKG